MKLIAVPPISSHWGLVRLVIIGAYLLLAILYATVTPIFEISDEVNHYPVVDYIATHGKLPIQNMNRPHPWDWEAAQPPLYYAIAALLVSPFDRSDLYTHHWISNPHAQIGISDTTHNRNVMIHDWERQSFVWRGTPLHVRIVRGFSILLSAGAVWLIFSIGRQLAPQTPAIAALMMALTAFNPMFIAIGASVNNDNMATFFVTLSLALSFTIFQDGFTWGRVWSLAVICVLAVAAKLSGGYAFIIAGIAIALTVYQHRLPIRKLVMAGLIFVLLWAVLLGWWYLRNWQLYDDLLGNYHMAQTVGLRDLKISALELLRNEWFSFYVAYWGGFGLLTYTAPASLFYYTGFLVLLAVLGGGLALRSGLNLRRAWVAGVPFLLLVVLLILGFVGVVSWSLLTPASQGRLLFPYNAALVALVALGLYRLLKTRLALLATLPLGLLAAYCGAVVIPSAFALPPTVDEPPRIAQRIDVFFDGVGLLAVDVENHALNSQNPDLKMTLYWQTARTNTPLSYFVVVYGRNLNGDLVVLGKRDSYPCYGLCATHHWPPNQLYAETIVLKLDHWPPDLDLPLQPRIHIGMHDHATNTTIQAYSTIGDPLETVFVHGGRLVDSRAGQPKQFAIEFLNTARLYDVQIQQVGGTLWVDVGWEPLQQPTENLTVFVQLIHPNQPQHVLASGDSPPRGAWWPTSAWVKHHLFTDRYGLAVADIAGGQYELLIGLYHPETFVRVPVRDGIYPDAYVQPITIFEP